MSAVKVFEYPDVYQIQLPMIQNALPTVNVYLIKLGSDCLLVDGGPKTLEAYDVLVQEFKNLKVDLDRLSAFITHPHFDHWGLLEKVLPKGAKVYVSAYDYQLTSEDENKRLESLYQKRLLEEGVPQAEHKIYAYLSYYFRLVHQDSLDLQFVGPNDAILLGHEAFEVLSASGHTPDHLALYHQKTGLYFSGDQVLEAMHPSIDLSFDGRDLVGNNLTNLHTLLTKSIIMLPGHGRVLYKPENVIRELYDHHKKRVDSFIQRIAEHPYSSGYEIIRQNKWSYQDRWEQVFFATRSFILRQGFSHLDHLLESEVIKSEIQDTTLVYTLK